MKLSKIDYERRLYVIDCGSGYSCLGFDILTNRATRLARELGQCWNHVDHNEATYAEYSKLQTIAHERFVKTGYRFQCELHPSLHAFVHERVEVKFGDGTTERFRVGRSTGWTPCYLRLSNSRSTGGGAVDRDEKIVSVRKIS